ncbi:MAG: CPBP family intramembrane metalloprotease [Clostridiaceae bacterium]|nr:CPBP family intramembrane metalloprotease [Clostridiaceae bacterium]
MEKVFNDKQKKLPVPFDSGLLYTVVAIYYVYVSQYIVKLNLPTELNLVLSQILFLVVPPVLLAVIRKYDIKNTFRLKAPKPLEVLLMLVISPVMVIAGFCAGFIGLLAVKGVFGRVYIGGDVTDLMSKNLLISLLLVAVLPAVCEELLFRGMIQRGLERIGAGWSIFLSGILFGLFHFDFQRLAAQTMIGFLAAYVVYRTGSIINGMILHFSNNGLLTLFANYMAGTEGQGAQVVTDPFDIPEFTQLAQQYNVSLEQLLGIMAAVFAVFLVISIVIIFGLIIILRAITKNTFEKPEKTKGSAKGMLIGLPGLLMIGIVYTGLGLMLLNNNIGQEILRFMGML